MSQHQPQPQPNRRIDREESMSGHASISAGSMTSSRFTEAVPLSVSSMAHHRSGGVPLDRGVLDGLEQILPHTLWECVNYARMVHHPRCWSLADLATTPYAWIPWKVESDKLKHDDLPYILTKLQFEHQYVRNAWIYLKPAIPEDLTLEAEQQFFEEHSSDWSTQEGILGRVTLLYTSTEALTQLELDGIDVEEMPPCILYKIIVEYRSLPATGNPRAVQAEELSMLSFGTGSVDDSLKQGALASLYDQHAKYVLEIYSVRGKKYKFDLMDATLSDGTVPPLPHCDGSLTPDPLTKSLCVTVRDYVAHNNSNQNQLKLQHTHSGDEKVACKDYKCAMTRMHLTMEGKPRQYSTGVDGNADSFGDLPPFHYLTDAMARDFIRLNPRPPEMVTASTSGHTLILDPAYAGQVYINGQYVCTWGADRSVGSHGVALFGMDLHSIPLWNGRIDDYELLKMAYAELWCELMVDARLQHLHIARRFLYRLMTGQDPLDESDGSELYDIDEDDNDVSPDVHTDCLESLVLSAPHYDVVGIAAKALATRLAIEYGRNSFPCLAHEILWVRSAVPDFEPLICPQRLINILRRGGYFDTQRTADILWFSESRLAREGLEAEVVKIAVEYLEASGCTILDCENILFVSSLAADNVIPKDAVCRWKSDTERCYVHQDFMTSSVDEYIGVNAESVDAVRIKGYLLGMYIAKALPFGKHLARYVVRNKLS